LLPLSGAKSPLGKVKWQAYYEEVSKGWRNNRKMEYESNKDERKYGCCIRGWFTLRSPIVVCRVPIIVCQVDTVRRAAEFKFDGPKLGFFIAIDVAAFLFTRDSAIFVVGHTGHPCIVVILGRERPFASFLLVIYC